MYAKLTWDGSSTISNICQDISNVITRTWVSGGNFDATTHIPQGTHGFSADIVLATSEIYCTEQSGYDVSTNPYGWQIHDAEGSTGTAGLAVLKAANGPEYGSTGQVFMGLLLAATTVTLRCYEGWDAATNVATNASSDVTTGGYTNLTTTGGSLYIWANRNIIFICNGNQTANLGPMIFGGKHTRQSVYDLDNNTYPNSWVSSLTSTFYKPKMLKYDGTIATTTAACGQVLTSAMTNIGATIHAGRTLNDGTNNYYQFFPLILAAPMLLAASTATPFSAGVTFANNGTDIIAAIFNMHLQLSGVVAFGDTITYETDTYVLLTYVLTAGTAVFALRKG